MAWSKSASVAPPCTRTRPVAGSSETARIAERSITTPPSHSAVPATLCPPPRTAVTIPASTARRSTVRTSHASWHVAIKAGSRATCPFQMARTLG
ncbi:Uncharacterised protein [Mycobacterium tuberculosis]|nr:Uncharacterised protein [Mycobacterium tuberculosis]COV02387.1 Uncharacterised protein [Mycobacterium tuberculosis]COV61795.1 Uncharacterised protein [Mycobacterium tuberculosis]COV83073.1 Uncharacterised protein [Mycobacterium tuberculosis]COV84505.1 Uncharacterised protein [Mycobacterium tuberculosis]